MRIQPWVRAWCACLAVVAGIVATAMHFDERPFQVPAFATVRGIMPLEAWAVTWSAVAVVAAVAGITRRRWAWRATALGASAIATTWALGILWARLVDGVLVSWTGVALWVWLVCSQAIAIASPLDRQVDRA